MANKIGCSSGRVTLIDPNDRSDLSSQSNISVPLEDLNISVILKTFRKGRTVLSKTAEGNSRESSNTISINFIEGSQLGGNKVLTTKYTDLTTVFEADTVNSETLGITNIDIDFNPSMAPMITIDFVDVRGSSIFQNEQNISGNNSGNKYSTFFQLPYPLFELTIKGYYGRPVTYCLHMLKFNSKFNSQTGNFEIQCQFIGYTYAMLSDMLIGYLKAIPYTKIGSKKYEDYNATRSTPILNLNELMKKISEINKEIPKLSSSSESAKSLNTTDEALESLDRMKGVIGQLGARLDIDDTEFKDEYNFILVDTTKQQSEIDAAITAYKDTIKTNIEEFNALAEGTASLKESDFNNIVTTGLDKGLYLNIKKLDLFESAKTIDASLVTSTGSEEGKNKFKKDLLEFVNRYYAGQGDEFTFNVYNMTAFIDKIKKTRVDMEATQEQIKKTLANELRDTFKKQLGFDPTIRNIIEIFTVAIEIFMETIYDVSATAENPGNTERNSELEKKFTINLLDKITDIKSSKLNNETNKFFAWPDYKEKEETTKTFVNKYLGAPGVLEAPYKVTELEFIDDLLAAFIKAQKEANEVSANADAAVTTWYPINVFDTKLFIDKEPYERMEMKSNVDVARMMIQRGMTFLGYTNNPSMFDPENKEIMAMAEIEADAILRVVKNEQLVQSLTQMTLKFLKEMNISTGVFYDPLLKEIGDNIVYNFPNAIPPSNNTNQKVIVPLNQDFTGFWDPYAPDKLKEKADNGAIFLTNYGSEYLPDLNGKPNDGGLYIKILTPSEYNTTNIALYQAPAGVTNESVFDYNKMTSQVVDYSAGYNSFGGPLGIQEYKNMDFNQSNIQGLPMMFSFYMDSDNGLAYNRKDSGVAQHVVKNFPTDSDLDYKPNGYVRFVKDKSEAYASRTDGVKLHYDLGHNRELLAKYVTGQKTDLTYPYIEQRFFLYDEKSDSDNGYLRQPYTDYSFSLFGSKYYYLQEEAKCVLANGTTKPCEDYAKALLFLETLPFTIDYNDESESIGMLDPTGANNQHGDPFKPYEQRLKGWEILHAFNKKGGFIHVPRLWAAHIGGILWMISTKDPVMDGDKIIGGGSGTNNPIVWKKDCNGEFFDKPSKTEYYPPILDITGDAQLVSYPDVLDSDIIRRIPNQVKEEFKRVFFEFVNGDAEGLVSFDDIKSKLEIWDGNAMSFCMFIKGLHDNKNEDSEGNYVFNGATIANESKFKNIDKYEIISPVWDWKFFGYTTNMHKDYLFLELKGDATNNEGIKTVLDAITQEVVIANATYKIWQNDIDGKEFTYDPIAVPKDKFDLYFTTLINTLKTKGDAYSPNEIKKQIEQQLFGTTDESTIKLILYNTCKNIHDKWLAGVTNPDNVIFKCGDSDDKPFRNISDTEVASKYGNSKPRLIDSFRFISRSFKDIGDKLFINPIPVNDFLVESPNTSAYNAMSGLLDANKFTFDALPTFINFRDPNNVKAIFEPIPKYEKAIENGSCGPSFVCVYAGQTSKHLDFHNSDYENDGFDFGCDENGNMIKSVPEDFTQDIGGGEDPIAVFKVVYGQQNQNVFKDIVLDQSEFSETDESLHIQDQISNLGSETNRSLAGQNIYNVYAVRSYSAQIEMMGNPMIQPMMYFQLDNIPMFHGAYMITRVKHSLKPNFMSTNFTGVRVRHAETRLVTAMDLFMSMVDAMDTSGAGTGNIGNGIINGESEQGGFVTYEVKENDGLKYQEKGPPPAKGDNWAQKEVGEFMQALAIKWHQANKDKPNGDTLHVNSFGAYGGGGHKKHSGSSLHYAGRAVDFSPMTKTKKNTNHNVGQSNYSQEKNIELIQMALDLDKSKKYGVRLNNIILNDKTIINHFSSYKNSQGGAIVIWSDGHANHLHIEFDTPDRVAKMIKEGKTSDGELVSNGVAGTISKYKGTMPSEAAKKAALGKIR